MIRGEHMQRLAPTLRKDDVSHDLISLIKSILAAKKLISFSVSQAQLRGYGG